MSDQTPKFALPDPLPSCAACGSTQVKIVLTTDFVRYLRCTECGAVWTLPRQTEGST
ncbi:MAG: hypothetical protein HYX76_11965 [Acidobacteria bacterium]|nr:hypothetical protein [Acidobacteriota bacterium]